MEKLPKGIRGIHDGREIRPSLSFSDIIPIQLNLFRSVSVLEGGFLILWRVFEVLERGDWIRSSYLRGAILRGSIRMVGKFGGRGYTGCLEGFCSAQFVSFVEFHLLKYNLNTSARIN